MGSGLKTGAHKPGIQSGPVTRVGLNRPPPPERVVPPSNQGGGWGGPGGESLWKGKRSHLCRRRGASGLDTPGKAGRGGAEGRGVSRWAAPLCCTHRCVRITDTGLSYLSTMSSLRSLYLRWCCQVPALLASEDWETEVGDSALPGRSARCPDPGRVRGSLGPSTPSARHRPSARTPWGPQRHSPAASWLLGRPRNPLFEPCPPAPPTAPGPRPDPRSAPPPSPPGRERRSLTRPALPARPGAGLRAEAPPGHEEFAALVSGR